MCIRDRLVGGPNAVFIVVDASGRGISGAADGAHPAEHLVHHRLTVERLIKPPAHCQLEKFGMLFKVDQQLIAHVVRLFDHSNRRIGGVTVKKIGGQPGDIDFPVLKGQQLIAHRHKLNPVGGGFPGAEAVKGGELIASGRSVIGGKAVRPAADEGVRFAVGHRVLHPLPDVLGQDFETAQRGQGDGVGVVDADFNPLRVEHLIS